MTEIVRADVPEQSLREQLRDAQRKTVLDALILHLEGYLPTDASPEPLKKMFGRLEGEEAELSFVVKTEIIDEEVMKLRSERSLIVNRIRRREKGTDE